MILLVKVLLAPALVVACSLAGRRWGPLVAGALSALPVVAGPILAITAVEQGTAFGARAASAALLGLVTLALFALTVAAVCRSIGWLPSLLAGWSVCLAADLAVSMVSTGPAAGLVVAVAALVGGERILAAVERRSPQPGPPGPAGRAAGPRMPWWDLPARAVATVVLVLTVTGVAGAVGPRLSGVLAPFPIGVSVVTGFALAQGGPRAAVSVLRGVCQGLLGFALFCYLVAVTVSPWGIGPAFAVATLVTPALQVGAQVWRAGRRPPSAALAGPPADA